MRQSEELHDAIFQISGSKEFEELALKVYAYQYEHVEVYRQFCDFLNHPKPTSWEEIPFIPIELFKTHRIMDDSQSKEDVLFLSSGTTGSIRSSHYVIDVSLYERSFFSTFELFFGKPQECAILALLPNYVEQGSSSLVYMVNQLIAHSPFPESGFYLQDAERLCQSIDRLRSSRTKIVLFGVSYALLDLAEKKLDLSGVTVVETGGMKGRRKEIIKEELHHVLSKGLNVQPIASEYGMTELLSQAYAISAGKFQTPPWMKIAIRDPEDPFTWLKDGKSGGISVIDLANLHSCSFIHTQDLGRIDRDYFYVLGRFDQSDIRGCNLLVNV
jgi:phenylacetate-coenzyme A ligase PaaK-like adenylate-forming protein